MKFISEASDRLAHPLGKEYSLCFVFSDFFPSNSMYTDNPDDLIADATALFADVAVLRLRTIKRASEETGTSQSFLKMLLRTKRLRRYKINSATFLSLAEFEKVALPDPTQSI